MYLVGFPGKQFFATLDLGKDLGNGFSAMTPKVQQTEKKHKLDFTKI